jgi:hypothetical protein
VVPAPHQAPYPTKNQKFNDEARQDSGSNFGRVARGRLMQAFIAELMDLPLSGIPALHWQSFLKIFADGARDAAIERGLASIRRDAEGAGVAAETIEKIERIIDAARELSR